MKAISKLITFLNEMIKEVNIFFPINLSKKKTYKLPKIYI